MSCSIEKLIAACAERELEWWIASDRSKLNLNLQYEVRVFEESVLREGPTMRVRTTGVSPYEAAGKALQALTAGEKQRP